MDLKVQKRLAAQIMKCSPKRVKFDEDRLDEIKESITKRDLRGLIGDKAIHRVPKRGVSRVNARKIIVQKRKGRRKGPGSRQGKFSTHQNPKTFWIHSIRFQRAFLRLLKEKNLIEKKTFNELMLKSKGGYFRSKRHIKLYLEEHNLFLKTKK